MLKKQILKRFNCTNDSGVPTALDTPQSLKNLIRLIRNHYVGRTFIEPSQSIRSLGVKLKLSTSKTIVKGKYNTNRQLLVRATCYKIVRMLYKISAKEVCKNSLS